MPAGPGMQNPSEKHIGLDNENGLDHAITVWAKFGQNQEICMFHILIFCLFRVVD